MLILLVLATFLGGHARPVLGQAPVFQEWIGTVAINSKYGGGFACPPGFGQCSVPGTLTGYESWYGDFNLTAVPGNGVIVGNAAGGGSAKWDVQYPPNTHCDITGACILSCTLGGPLPSTLSIFGELYANGSASLGFSSSPLVFAEACNLSNGQTTVGVSGPIFYGGGVDGVTLQDGFQKTSTLQLATTTVVLAAPPKTYLLVVTLEDVTGPVTIETPSGIQEQAKDGNTLDPGKMLVTGPTGHADALVSDGSSVQVGDSSGFSWRKAGGYAWEGVWTAGKIFLSLEPHLWVIRVGVGAGEIIVKAIRGTEFSMQLVNGNLTVMEFDGAAQVADLKSGASVLLNSSQQITINTDLQENQPSMSREVTTFNPSAVTQWWKSPSQLSNPTQTNPLSEFLVGLLSPSVMIGGFSFPILIFVVAGLVFAVAVVTRRRKIRP